MIAFLIMFMMVSAETVSKNICCECDCDSCADPGGFVALLVIVIIESIALCSLGCRCCYNRRKDVFVTTNTITQPVQHIQPVQHYVVPIQQTQQMQQTYTTVHHT